MGRAERDMRILISAYGCEPNRGSEASHGWNWVHGLAIAGHDVHVLTTPAGKSAIEEFLRSEPLPNLKFVYVNIPNVPARFGALRAGIRSLLWQHSALAAAEKLKGEFDFEVVHHVTWGSLHIGSRLWRLGRPFVFGPVGGGQVAPRGFRRYFRGEWLLEFVRSIVVRNFTGILFNARSTVRHASMVWVTNYETLSWVKKLGGPATDLMPDVGTSKALLVDPSTRLRPDPATLRILWVGRLLPRKGVLLALEALANVSPNVHFFCTIMGDGKQGHFLPEWIEGLKLSERVAWKGQVPWSHVLSAYLDHDVFLFTSLRDTAGSQLMEAMARGNAIITLDHHGARAVVPSNAGIKVPVGTPRETAARLARAIERLATEPETLASMSNNAIKAAEENTWERKVARACTVYRSLIDNSAPAAVCGASSPTRDMAPEQY